jgi:hypothetical protein
MTDDLKPTDMPMPLHDAMWTTVDAAHLTDNTVSNLRFVHREAHDALRAILSTHKAVMADPMQSPAANLHRSHTYAERHKATVLDKTERAIKRAREVIAELDETMDRVPDGPDSSMARAISDRLHGMPKTERDKVLGAALSAMDLATIGAVMRGPAYLHGLSESERDMLRAQYRQARHPDLLARKVALERGIELAGQGVLSMARRLGELYDAGKLRAAENAAYAAQKALNGQ